MAPPLGLDDVVDIPLQLQLDGCRCKTCVMEGTTELSVDGVLPVVCRPALPALLGNLMNGQGLSGPGVHLR